MAQAAGACAACRPLGVTVARLRPAVRLPQAAAAAHQRQLRQRRCPDRCCRVQASFDPYQKRYHNRLGGGSAAEAVLKEGSSSLRCILLMPPPQPTSPRVDPLLSSRSPLFQSEVFQKEMDGLAQEM